MNLVSNSVLDSGISLLGNGLSDTLLSWKADEGLGALSEKEDVGGSGGKGVAGGVLDVDNVKATWVSLSGEDGTDSADVLTADHLAHVTGVELDPVGDLVGGNVELDGVADLAVWVGVSDGSAVVCDQVWDVVLLVEDLLHSAELVGGLLGGDSVDDESAFGVVDESEVLVGLLKRDDIHESGWVLDISSHLSVDLDHAAHHDLLALLAGEGVVESVSDEDGQWQALSELVGSGVGSEAENSASFGEHPVVRGRQGFEMFLRSSSSHCWLFFCLTFGFCKFDLRL